MIVDVFSVTERLYEQFPCIATKTLVTLGSWVPGGNGPLVARVSFHDLRFRTLHKILYKTPRQAINV